ncbi:unnamed protein product [Lampetra fluviatilis]
MSRRARLPFGSKRSISTDVPAGVCGPSTHSPRPKGASGPAGPLASIGSSGGGSGGGGSGGSANGVRAGRQSRSGSAKEAFDLSFKVMVIGDSGVGKTCLLMRFKDGAFLSGSYIATVGIDFKNKVVTIDDIKVKLQIWDTAGQERFRSVTHAYYRDADALLLCYDVSNRASFENVRSWLTEVQNFADSNVVLMLIGNKADLGGQRVVRLEDGERLAKECKVPFMETSARSGLNVELAFMALAKALKQRELGKPDEPKFQLKEYVEAAQHKSSCCLTS